MQTSWRKLIKSLHQKKYRYEEKMFFVEGAKSVAETVTSDFKIEALFGTEKFFQEYDPVLPKPNFYTETVKRADLEQVGTFQSNEYALAVLAMPQKQILLPPDQWFLALADIADPGNLGTIIRLADWYGIRQIICSPQTTDWYSPKTLNASMGSFLRIKPYYTDLQDFIPKSGLKTYGTVLGGTNLHKITKFEKNGILLMGNEAKGIPDSLLPLLDSQISIPSFGQAESLNVAIATAICLDHLRQKMG